MFAKVARLAQRRSRRFLTLSDIIALKVYCGKPVNGASASFGTTASA